MSNKKIFSLLAFFLIIALIVLQIFAYRANYLTKTDLQYSQDLFDHSQWRLPKNVRYITDDLLYQVAGYQLVTKWNLFDINPEMPPLGKYFYGFAIIFFKNALIASLLLYLLAVFLFYIMAKQLYQKSSLVILAVLIFVLEPMIFSQMATTMLDLPQLVMLFLHIIAVFKIMENSRNKLVWLFLAGFSLGSFVSIKIGFFAIPIILADLFFLLNQKKIKFLLTIFLIAGLTYTLSYLPYLIQGHSIIDFLKAQKWMVVFHLSSKAKPIPGLMVISMLTGFYKGWSELATWERIREWSFMWIVYLTTLLFSVGHLLNNNKLPLKIKYLVTLSVLLMGIYLFTPFWPRYLVLVIPFLILLLIFLFIHKTPSFLKLLIVLILIIKAFMYLIPNPNDKLEIIADYWQEGTYQDLYSQLLFNSKKPIKRQQFWRQTQAFETKLKVVDRSVTIEPVKVWPWQKTIPVKINLTYYTALGPINQQVKTSLIKIDNNWLMNWNDRLLLKDYNSKSQITVEIDQGQNGILMANNQIPLSYDDMRPYFYVTHNQIRNEEALQTQLLALTGKVKYEQEYSYKANYQPDWPAKIGLLKPQIAKTEVQQIKLQPGISYRLEPTRAYNSIDFKKKIKIIKKIEKKYRHQLFSDNGGQIIFKNPGKKKLILVSQKRKDGHNVILPKSYNQILGIKNIVIKY